MKTRWCVNCGRPMEHIVRALRRYSRCKGCGVSIPEAPAYRLRMPVEATIGEKWGTSFPTLNELQNRNSHDILPSVKVEQAEPKYTPNFKHCEYLEKLIRTDRLKQSLELACQALMGWEFTTVAFRGVSGALIGPALALRLDKTMICVRKPKDGSHSKWRDTEENLAEGDAGARRYIIADDFISSGTTAKAIFEQVKNFAPHAECLGVLEVCRITDDRLFQHRGSRYPLNNKWR